jgi:hypothetical protein
MDHRLPLGNRETASFGLILLIGYYLRFEGRSATFIFIVDPKAAEIADKVAKNILQAQAIENQQVCVGAFAVAKRLRDIQSEAETKLKPVQRSGSEASAMRAQELYEDANDQLRQIYGEVMFVYADMTARIKLSSGTPPEIPIQTQQLLSTGSLARPVLFGRRVFL